MIYVLCEECWGNKHTRHQSKKLELLVPSDKSEKGYLLNGWY